MRRGRISKPIKIALFVAAVAVVLFLGWRLGKVNSAKQSGSQPGASSSPTVAGYEIPDSPSPSSTPTDVASAKYKVPILMYHYIRVVTDPKDNLGFNLSVTPGDFESQVKWLTDNGYQTFPLADFCQGKIPVDKKPVILTFDDGYDNAYTQALPILKKYAQTGTFFIVKNFLNKPEYLTSEQLAKMGSEGMELADHTADHIDLATASAAKQKTEIDDSKQASPVFAYPAGKYSQTTIDLVKQAGLICAVTTHPGIATEKSPLYELPRVRVSGGEGIGAFEKGITGK